MTLRAPSVVLSLLLWALLCLSCGSGATFRYEGEGEFIDRGQDSIYPRYEVKLGTLHVDRAEVSARFRVGVLPEASYELRVRPLGISEPSPGSAEKVTALLTKVRQHHAAIEVTVRRRSLGGLEYVGRISQPDKWSFRQHHVFFFSQHEVEELAFCKGEEIAIEVTVKRWPPESETELEVSLVGGGRPL